MLQISHSFTIAEIYVKILLMNKKNSIMKPELPVGYYKFSKKQFFNYQLNRWYSLGYTVFEEIREAGRRIKSFENYKTVFIELAERAKAEGRLKNSAFYYRAAEFLTSPYTGEKDHLYDLFSSTFYEGFKEEGVERYQIPYSGAFLSAMRLKPEIPSKGTIIIHGGFDSFIEEFFCMWKYFAACGYTVIAFDGPGQGATLIKNHVPFTHDWELPVGAVLDYFKVDNAALMGISFGGYWCVRATAFEKRIKYVIINPPFYDLLEKTSPVTRGMVHWMMKHRKMMNMSIRMRTKFIPTLEHVVTHCLHINRCLDAEPIFAAEWLLQMNKNHIHSELVDQHVLLTAGEKDKFQTVKLLYLQEQALVNAKSKTVRVFTKKEQGENHCQMGNLPLALSYMTDWLDAVITSN